MPPRVSTLKMRLSDFVTKRAAPSLVTANTRGATFWVAAAKATCQGADGSGCNIHLFNLSIIPRSAKEVISWKMAFRKAMPRWPASQVANDPPGGGLTGTAH